MIVAYTPQAAAPTRYFYFYMALACAAVAFLGFAPTYWVPLTHGTFPASPVVHLHGFLFFTWTLYFAFQSWLAASGSVAWHRSLGIVGVLAGDRDSQRVVRTRARSQAPRSNSCLRARDMDCFVAPLVAMKTGSTHPNDAFTQIRMPGLRKRAGPALPAGLRYPRLRAAIAVHECRAPEFR